MNRRLTGRNALAYIGVEATTPPQMVTGKVDPTSTESSNFDIGTFWLTKPSNSAATALWLLGGIAQGVATWEQIFPGGGSGVTTVNGTTNQITASPTTGNIVLSIPNAFVAPGTITSIGTLTASSNLTVAGTTTLSSLNTSGMVVNSSAGILSTVTTTNHAVQVGNAAGQITSLALGTAGFVLTSNGAGADPSFQASAANITSITGTANQVTVNPTTGAVIVSLPVAIIAPGSVTTTTSLTAGNGFTVSAGTITLTPLATSGIVVNNGTGVISTLATTNHAVQVGNAAGQVTSLAVGTDGQILLGATGANPSWVTPTAGSGLSVTATSGALSFAITAPVSIANGGTNATSMATTDGVVIYDGTRLVTTSAGTAGQVLTSNGPGLAPTYQAAAPGVSSITGTANQITASAATGAVTLSTPATFIAPGSITATTSITATNGNITATSGNVVITNGRLTLPATSATVGQITLSGALFMHAAGGSTNTFLGSGAGNTSIAGGINDTGIGSGALAALVSGDGNTVVGSTAFANLTSGIHNIGIGFSAGGNCTSNEQNNIYIGWAVGGVTGQSNVLQIGQGTGTLGGELNKAIICGISGKTSTAGIAVLVNASNVLGTTTSSREFKENIHDMGDASAILYKMRPVTFNYKPELLNDATEADLIQYGLIAEELEEIAPDLVAYDKTGKPNAIRYHFIHNMLINEIQKLNARIEKLEGEKHGS